MRCIRLAAAVLVAAAVIPAAADELIERGEYLARAGGCVECHTADSDDAIPLAGGRELVTPFGTFYTPNITPDPATGIGGWSEADFLRASWEGVSPAGEHYYPAFPYPAYTGLTRDDLLAIRAWLAGVEPVVSETPDHELAWYIATRLAAGAWKLAHFAAGRFVPEPGRSPEWNRGAYLVRHLGHCGECHTPRGRTGALVADRELGGATLPDGERVPNITPHDDDGIGRWTTGDIEYFLDVGMLPDGDFTGGSMSAVIDSATSVLTREDRLAVAVYLQSLPALPARD
ncbi:MAG: cytochrome c [Woeseiaceae bacterium]|nr:cytochrome c [Woeseiaceae bacterium]